LRNTQSQKSKSTQFFFIKKNSKKTKKEKKEKTVGFVKSWRGVGGWLAGWGGALKVKYLISK